MLAFADDAALARLVIAATAISFVHVLPPHADARPASNGPRTPDILQAPTKHCRYYSMPQPRPRRHGPQPDRRRALELLAGSPTGCTEVLLFAHGVTVEMLVELIRAGLATASTVVQALSRSW